MRCTCPGGDGCDHKLPCEARPVAGLYPECVAASPWCPTCGGNAEVNVCPPRCDGSHVADYPVRCGTCHGTGHVRSRPYVRNEEQR